MGVITSFITGRGLSCLTPKGKPGFFLAVKLMPPFTWVQTPKTVRSVTVDSPISK